MFCSLKSLQSLAQHLALNSPQDVFLGRLAGDGVGLVGHREGVWFIPHSWPEPSEGFEQGTWYQLSALTRPLRLLWLGEWHCRGKRGNMGPVRRLFLQSRQERNGGELRFWIKCDSQARRPAGGKIDAPCKHPFQGRGRGQASLPPNTYIPHAEPGSQ